MKNAYSLVGAILFILLLFSCEKEEFNEDFLRYRKAETQCADPWESYSSQSNSYLAVSVKEYLTERDIVFDEVVVGYDSTLFQVCRSCDCTTGRYIEVNAPIIHEEVLNEIGFFVVSNE